jgi:hypothetical protein
MRGQTCHEGATVLTISNGSAAAGCFGFRFIEASACSDFAQSLNLGGFDLREKTIDAQNYCASSRKSLISS